MNKYPYLNSPRCGAKTKQNNGAPCRSPAVKSKKRCRIHGGANGSGAQKDNKNALKHGLTTTLIKNFRKTARSAIKEAEAFNREVLE
jgi:hypothetical protein